jgi:hypothetical protein
MGNNRQKSLPLRNSDALTRRSILRRAGWIVAAAAIPPAALFGTKYGVVMAARATSPVMARLSTYMSEAGNHALPDEVVEKAKHHILDTIAAMVSGSQLAPARQSNLPAPMAVKKLPRSSPQISCVVPSRRRLQMDCWLIPMRLTTPMLPLNLTPALPSFPQVWPPESNLVLVARISCAR